MCKAIHFSLSLSLSLCFLLAHFHNTWSHIPCGYSLHKRTRVGLPRCFSHCCDADPPHWASGRCPFIPNRAGGDRHSLWDPLWKDQVFGTRGRCVCVCVCVCGRLCTSLATYHRFQSSSSSQYTVLGPARCRPGFLILLHQEAGRLARCWLLAN